MMKPDQGTLYILSDARPGDPLDCISAAAPHLAPHYTSILSVGPSQAMSVRALRRAYEPGVDRLFYDFTAPGDHSWAIGMLQDAPAAALLGGDSPFAPDAALADLRSAQRYAASGGRFSPAVTIGVLDPTSPPIAGASLTRPAVPVAPATEAGHLMLSIAPGAVETAYAALLGLRTYDAAVTLLTATRRDANDLTDIVVAFKMDAAQIRYIRDRAGVLASIASTCGMIDVRGATASAASDAAFAAGCVGAPVLALTAPTGAAAAAGAFAATKPRKDPAAATGFAAARPLAPFAGNLHALVETGFSRALQSDDAA